MRLKVLGSAEDALRAMTEQLIEKMNMRGISPFHLALSGAGTAQQMFGLWIREYREKIKWEQLRFYWVDERCVSPDDEESNFKHADELLFRPLDIPHAHVHRIHGEREPEVEAEHYSELVKWDPDMPLVLVLTQSFWELEKMDILLLFFLQRRNY